MTRETPRRPDAGPTTARSIAFVAEHRADADRLGVALAELLQDPPAFVAALRAGFDALADEEYRRGQELVAPGIGRVIGVRGPLAQATSRSLSRRLRHVPPATLLFLADALLREPVLELRWFGVPLLVRILPDDPERAWQLMRRMARDAGDWITVDTLAHAYGAGILAEPYRWAELEQLVYSPSRWERRLVGSTLATIPFVDHVRGRTPDVAVRGLGLVGDLIGDAEPDVQKALSWALRSLTLADRTAVAAFCARQAGEAADSSDGHRAWVVRDTLAKLDPTLAAELRAVLGPVRRRPGAPSTSRAASIAGGFGRLPEPRLAEEPRLDARPLAVAGSPAQLNAPDRRARP